MAGTAYVGYTTGRDALRQASFNSLTHLRVSRTQQVESWFSQVENGAIALAEMPTTINAMKAFRDGFNQLNSQTMTPELISELWFFYEQDFIPKLQANVDGVPRVKTYFPPDNAARYLQYHYRVQNPYPVEESDRLDNPKDGSQYSEAHQTFHPLFREFVKRLGYQDLMLIDSATGTVVYNVTKSTALGHNLERGIHANSRVGQIFNDLRQGNPRSFALTDFELSPMLYGQPTAYIGSPIFDGSTMIGILALSFSIDDLNQIMTGNYQWEESGLGQTGETILVGSDRLMRSQSRLLVESPSSYFQELKERQVPPKIIERIKNNNNSILWKTVDYIAVEKALNGESGTDVLTDYRGASVLVSYAPLRLNGNLDWVILATIQAREVFFPIHKFGRNLAIAAVIIILVVTLISFLMSRYLIAPIHTLMRGTRQIASGNTKVEVRVKSRDEFFRLAQCFNQMAVSLDRKKDSLEEQIKTNDELLRKILPDPIVNRLKQGEENISNQFDSVTLIYINLLGFNAFSQTQSCQDAVAILNDLHDICDDASTRHKVEEIAMFSSLFIGAIGLFIPRLDRNRSAVEYSLEVLKIIRRFGQDRGYNFDLRIGIHTGPVTGGLAGKSKLSYSLFGEATNVARMLELNCQSNTIAVSQTVYESLKDLYHFVDRGELDISETQKIRVWELQES